MLLLMPAREGAPAAALLPCVFPLRDEPSEVVEIAAPRVKRSFPQELAA